MGVGLASPIGVMVISERQVLSSRKIPRAGPSGRPQPDFLADGRSARRASWGLKILRAGPSGEAAAGTFSWMVEVQV